MIRSLMLLAFLAGCASDGAYVPRRRDYTLRDAATDGEPPPAGSLWQPSRPLLLFTDVRAVRENDVIVVRIDEAAEAWRSADTDLERGAKYRAGLSAFLERVTAARLAVGAEGDAQASAQAVGSTSRSDRLTATIPALVRKVLPNGNLFIEGHRSILVNAEEHHFYISGVVRSTDIEADNSVRSDKIADAEIEFTGRGVLSEGQPKGTY